MNKLTISCLICTFQKILVIFLTRSLLLIYGSKLGKYITTLKRKFKHLKLGMLVNWHTSNMGTNPFQPMTNFIILQWNNQKGLRKNIYILTWPFSHIYIYIYVNPVFFDPPMFFLSDEGLSLEALDNYPHISAVLKPFWLFHFDFHTAYAALYFYFMAFIILHLFCLRNMTVWIY